MYERRKLTLQEEEIDYLFVNFQPKRFIVESQIEEICKVSYGISFPLISWTLLNISEYSLMHLNLFLLGCVIVCSCSSGKEWYQIRLSLGNWLYAIRWVSYPLFFLSLNNQFVCNCFNLIVFVFVFHRYQSELCFLFWFSFSLGLLTVWEIFV